MDHDRILQFVRSNGPILPAQLAGEIKQNLIITGAVLSELAKAGKIKISNTKVGGSPVYYTEEQRYKLQGLYKNLNEKDQRAYNLLKEKRVLRDRELTPLVRVSLRNIKDFAKAVEVSAGGEKELFWRWYVLSMQDAEPLIKSILNPQAAQKAEAGKLEQPEPARPALKPEQPQASPEQPEPARPALKPEQPQAAPEKPGAGQRTVARPEQAKTARPGTETEKPQAGPQPEEPESALHEKTKKYFNDNNINILDVEVIKKKTEIDYIIEVPSSLGTIRYYCKARAKKKSNEGDVAQVYVKGQKKKLPVLYLSTGDLTRKAQEAIGKEYENIKFKKLG